MRVPKVQRDAVRRCLTTAAAAALVATLAGCGGVQVRATDTVPRPLVDELPLRAGIYYSKEFRDYTAREERWNTKWTITLGPAQVTETERLAKALFASVIAVADLAKPPPLDLILEPRIEEYSFVTPRDSGAELYAVTIKYRINVYDGAAHLVDSLVFTGYGSEAAGNFSSSAPLAAATAKAMRDAAAKFASEFGEQAVVQKLARHEPVEPLPASGQAPAEGSVAEVKQPSGPPPTPKIAPTAAPAAAATAVPAEPAPAPTPEPASAPAPAPAPAPGSSAAPAPAVPPAAPAPAAPDPTPVVPATAPPPAAPGG